MTPTTSTPRWTDRLGALSGAAYVVLILVGNQIASGNSTDPHPSGAKDLADFSGTPTAVQTVGFSMEILGFVAFMVFLGWFGQALRSRGDVASWVGAVASTGGIVTLAVKLGSAAPILTGELDHRELSTTMARVLADMNGAAFVITFLPFGVFLAASGFAILASGLLGRTFGWIGAVVGLLGVVVPLLTHFDTVNTNPMPFLLGLLWLLAVSLVLGIRGPRPAAAETTAAREPAAVAA